MRFIFHRSLLRISFLFFPATPALSFWRNKKYFVIFLNQSQAGIGTLSFS